MERGERKDHAGKGKEKGRDGDEARLPGTFLSPNENQYLNKIK